MKVSHLSDSDKRAVDMLLNDVAESSLNTTGFTPAKGFVSPAAMDAARSILSRLDHLDVGEPPADLMARCMARIDRAVMNGEGVSPGVSNPAVNMAGVQAN